ncbi:hypothetical protein [Pedobacter borealis]|uniref:hypothetical protein n=1 Tax=Pedobacter borealis TaxID=475254 RepID=UPI0004939276|nr:hypothetical protein [Pedobacter borealis]
MIHIPHRFLERLTASDNIKFISLLIVGTFNPGEPYLELLNDLELKEFSLIKENPKFKKFNLVKNFYDRPQNRFWKIMDIISNQSFYADKPLKTINRTGLKFYRKLDRDVVFEAQKSFCLKNGVFITDIVREIRTDKKTTHTSIAAKIAHDGIKMSRLYKRAGVVRFQWPRPALTFYLAALSVAAWRNG